MTSGHLHHAWGVIILTGTLRLEPVAVAAANPNPGAAGVPVNFDGSGSFHQDPAQVDLVIYTSGILITDNVIRRNGL